MHTVCINAKHGILPITRLFFFSKSCTNLVTSHGAKCFIKLYLDVSHWNPQRSVGLPWLPKINSWEVKAWLIHHCIMLTGVWCCEVCGYKWECQGFSSALLSICAVHCQISFSMLMLWTNAWLMMSNCNCYISWESLALNHYSGEFALKVLWCHLCPAFLCHIRMKAVIFCLGDYCSCILKCLVHVVLLIRKYNTYFLYDRPAG